MFSIKRLTQLLSHALDLEGG